MSVRWCRWPSRDVGTGGPDEWATAAAMDRSEAAAGEFAALLLLGDNSGSAPAPLPNPVAPTAAR
jgi:hypothetical protein